MPARTPAIKQAAEGVGQFILIIRRQRVLLDEDLAALYGVETRSLVQAVKRNAERSRRISCSSFPRLSGKL